MLSAYSPLARCKDGSQFDVVGHGACSATTPAVKLATQHDVSRGGRGGPALVLKGRGAGVGGRPWPQQGAGRVADPRDARSARRLRTVSKAAGTAPLDAYPHSEAVKVSC